MDFVERLPVASDVGVNQPGRHIRVETIQLAGDIAAIFKVQGVLKLCDDCERARDRPGGVTSLRSAASRASPTTWMAIVQHDDELHRSALHSL